MNSYLRVHKGMGFDVCSKQIVINKIRTEVTSNLVKQPNLLSEVKLLSPVNKTK